MNLLNKLERKFGRYYIPNLMLYIVIGNLIVFIFDYLFPELLISSYMYFDRDAVLSGQVWRVLSFILVPFNSNPVFMLISCYFYWLIGSQLEQVWGGFRFNVFYLTGIIGTIIGGFISGYASAGYLNLSLFLAYALLFPNERFLLFFFIPVKAKWLAWIDAAFLLYDMIMTLAFGYWQISLCIIISFLNLALFFGGGVIQRIKVNFKSRKVRREWRDVRIKMTSRDDKDNDNK
ncbi:MAG: hypothetical protein ACI4SF_09060 [Oscillospiraceae bacterium]